jgi:uncharacterized protein YjbI with pentapeptide repeats
MFSLNTIVRNIGLTGNGVSDVGNVPPALKTSVKTLADGIRKSILKNTTVLDVSTASTKESLVKLIKTFLAAHHYKIKPNELGENALGGSLSNVFSENDFRVSLSSLNIDYQTLGTIFSEEYTSEKIADAFSENDFFSRIFSDILTNPLPNLWNSLEISNMSVPNLSILLTEREPRSCLSRKSFIGVDFRGQVLTDHAKRVLADLDLSDANLSGLDLSGANLSNTNLSGTDLQGTNLKGALIAGATFSQVTKLQGSCLSGLDLSRRDLSRCDLSGCNLSGCDLSNTNLKGASIVGAIFTGANLSHANLSGLDLSGYLNLTNANFTSANLDRANLRGTNLTNANFTSANLDMANLQGTNLSEAIIYGAKITNNTTLTEANLSDAKLKSQDFTNVNLTDVNLSGAQLTAVKFGTDLTGTNFIGASLIDCDLKLSPILFAEANLKNCNLEGLNLSNLNLSKVTFDSCNLKGTKFYNAILRGATFCNMDEKQLSGIKFIDPNKCPSGISSSRKSSIKEERIAAVTGKNQLNLVGAFFTNLEFPEKVSLAGANLIGAKFLKVTSPFMYFRYATSWNVKTTLSIDCKSCIFEFNMRDIQIAEIPTENIDIIKKLMDNYDNFLEKDILPEKFFSILDCIQKYKLLPPEHINKIANAYFDELLFDTHLTVFNYFREQPEENIKAAVAQKIFLEEEATKFLQVLAKIKELKKDTDTPDRRRATVRVLSSHGADFFVPLFVYYFRNNQAIRARFVAFGEYFNTNYQYVQGILSQLKCIENEPPAYFNFTTLCTIAEYDGNK